MANIKQVAALAELSVSCVSKYLKNPDSVRDSSKEKIEYAIKELNYVPSALARNLRTKRTGVIKIISHNITNPFFAELFEMIRSRLEKKGYITSLQSIDYMEHRIFSRRDFEQIDGVILCFLENEKTLESIDANIPAGFPCINLHGYKSLQSAASIITDVRKGSADAAEYFIKAGCRNPAYIGASEYSTISKLKFSGFHDAVKNSYSDITFKAARNYAFTMQDGFEAAKFLFGQNPSIDAVFCENDLFAAGTIHYLTEHNIKIPDDVQIIGYDNVPLASMFLPSISSVSIPSEQISDAACSGLISLIQKQGAKDLLFIPELVYRSSTTGATGGIAPPTEFAPDELLS